MHGVFSLPMRVCSVPLRGSEVDGRTARPVWLLPSSVQTSRASGLHCMPIRKNATVNVDIDGVRLAIAVFILAIAVGVNVGGNLRFNDE